MGRIIHEEITVGLDETTHPELMGFVGGCPLEALRARFERRCGLLRGVGNFLFNFQLSFQHLYLLVEGLDRRCFGGCRRACLRTASLAFAGRQALLQQLQPTLQRLDLGIFGGRFFGRRLGDLGIGAQQSADSRGN